MRKRLLSTCVFLAFTTLMAGAVRAQDEEREGPDDPFADQGDESFTSVRGTVSGEKEQPLVAAKVTLTIGEEPKVATRTTKTDKKGRWSVGRLKPGVYRIAIDAPGYIQSTGQVKVLPMDRSPQIKVEMRPLSEVSPAGYEGNPKSILDWLQKGNSLLAQGHYAEARAEYEKAVPQLSGKDLAQVLRTMARTYYLEGDRETTLLTLKKSLIAEPTNPEGRQLLTALLEGMNRGQEAKDWLARLDREGPEALAGELGGSEPDAGSSTSQAAEDSIPAEPAAANRVGAYKTFFTERSPLSPIDAWSQRFVISPADIASADPAKGQYDLAKETFEVFVPDTYRPEEGWGVIVWVSPGSGGAVRRPELRAALAAHHLIWIGANRSGNDRPRWTRMGLALDAVHNVQKLYRLDPARVFVAGYSGGGRVSSALSMVYPEIFQGAFCIMGIDYFRKIPVPDKPGASWPPGYPAPPAERLDEMKRDHRWVLLTGERDFNRAQTKATLGELQKDGFAQVTYLEVPGASHYDGLQAEWFGRGLDALTAPRSGGHGSPP